MKAASKPRAARGRSTSTRSFEGEERGEARHLVGGPVVERHRVDVRHPPRAVADALVQLVAREVDQVGADGGVALETEVVPVVGELVGEVEAEGDGWSRGGSGGDMSRTIKR